MTVVGNEPWWQILASWGAIGSLVGGLSTALLAMIAIVGGTAGLGDWRAKMRAEQALAEEQAKEIRLERRRLLYGWCPGNVEVYRVSLVTDPDEAAHVQQEMKNGGPSEYVVLRVTESKYGNVNRAHSLRQMIRVDGYVARAPTPAEYEALQQGRDELLVEDG